jgi:hypothetical protein
MFTLSWPAAAVTITIIIAVVALFWILNRRRYHWRPDQGTRGDLDIRREHHHLRAMHEIKAINGITDPAARVAYIQAKAHVDAVEAASRNSNARPIVILGGDARLGSLAGQVAVGADTLATSALVEKLTPFLKALERKLADAPPAQEVSPPREALPGPMKPH